MSTKNKYRMVPYRIVRLPVVEKISVKYRTNTVLYASAHDSQSQMMHGMSDHEDRRSDHVASATRASNTPERENVIS